jgi:antitoxin component YwqK of YwqJK toxin-antitoxin module
VQGEKDGVFREYDRKGELLNLYMYEDGKIKEDAEELMVLDIRAEYYEDGSIKTVGGYKDNMKQGVHREYDKSGKVVNGYLYENGEITAEGIVDAAGTYQQSWKVFYASGELKSEGDFTDGKRVGMWTFYHKNGQVEQKGKYLRGMPQGEWKWYYADGLLHREESYRKGLEDGWSFEYEKDGEIITKGEYIDGYKEGEWFYKVGDHTEVGSFVADMKSGEWEHTYDNGKNNFVGEFIDGNGDGKHKYWYRNGRVMMEGKFTMGVKDGEWKYYNEDGIITMTAIYEMGIERKIDGFKIKPSFDEEVTEQ